MIEAQAGTYVEAIGAGFDPGLLGTIGVRLEDGEANIVMARRVTGIIESPAGSGIYTTQLLAPAAAGTYTVIWDDGTVFAPEQLVVTVPEPATRPGPPSVSGPGPCNLWTDEEGIEACCTAPEGADLDYAAEVASTVLWDLSGRRYGGVCRAVVRPQDDRPGCGIGPWDRPRFPAGCRRLTTIRLAGHPIREVEEVRLGGVVLDPSEYRLFGQRELVRTGVGDVWPSCQYLERDATEDGTFQVTYTFGQDPPVTGQLAAAKLACEVAKACAGAECNLPKNLERLVRQGVQVGVATQAREAGGFGVPEVDLFLATVGPRHRRSAVVSPDTRRYPLVVSVGPAEGGGS